MPNQQAQQLSSAPSPCTITPALLKTHSITPDEYTRIEKALGRIPSLTELGIFSVMWSEHCSYKSSRVHLKRLPTRGTRTSGPGSVVQGPGENAGIIDVGDGWACAFKIESHNHPSYIEPYQGAATGVGGILRDIFTMNARPLAVMDSLRFGPLDEAEPDEVLRRKNHQITTGVVHGVAGYGNCFGVPNLGGETRFEPCYSGNPLLNAFALGLVRIDEIFYAKATGVGNPVIYVGAKTGRDGIHGATMASEEFTEGSEQKRPNVQMGDPFLEKLLLEACLEAMTTGAVLGIQDMGAAGLTCSTCEMGARGSLGLTIELDLVPQRETGMSSYEIMLSESQERMLLVAAKGHENIVLEIFAKWGLDASIVGIVTADDTMRVTHHGELVAVIPNKALTDDAPVYHRPVGTWTPPVPKDPPAWVLEELNKPRDYTADLKKLLASANICDKRFIFEQYDSMVQTNTVQGPGGEAGVMRIKRTGHQPAFAATESQSPYGQSTPSQAASPRPESEHTSHTASSRPESQRTSHTSSSRPESQRTSHTSSSRPESQRSGDGAERSPHFASDATETSPVAAQHTLAGDLANLIASSTPEGEATLSTGNQDAANPVLFPDPTHSRPATKPGAPGLDSETWDGNATAPERGLAMALAGNGRWCYLDPKLGAMHAVAEAARKVACTGATPVSATNCLNFGNPEKPEIMAQLSAAIDGIAEACTALGTPVTGGNVSLYNETRGEGIYPTPVIGIVGILDDVTKAVPNSFQRAGEAVLIIGEGLYTQIQPVALRELGSSEFAKAAFKTQWGEPPRLSLEGAAELHRCLAQLADGRIITSAFDVGSGGIATALAKAALSNSIGINAEIIPTADAPIAAALFGEMAGVVIVTCDKKDVARVIGLVQSFGTINAGDLGVTTDGDLQITVSPGIAVDGRGAIIQLSLCDLRTEYANALETQLAAEALL